MECFSSEVKINNVYGIKFAINDATVLFSVVIMHAGTFTMRLDNDTMLPGGIFFKP
jgi:hypothetical protein